MGTSDTRVARWFAIAAHGDQMYGQHPYSYHLDDAVNELIDHVIELPVLRFYDHQVIMCATYLHDVLEDTETSIKALDGLFEEPIGELVRAVTDGPGKNRKERKKGVYKAIQAVGPAALAVKLADRLANAKTAGLAKGESDLLKMYRKEQTDFEMELCGEVAPWYAPSQKLHGFLPAFRKIREYLGMTPWQQKIDVTP